LGTIAISRLKWSLQPQKYEVGFLGLCSQEDNLIALDGNLNITDRDRMRLLYANLWDRDEAYIMSIERTTQFRGLGYRFNYNAVKPKFTPTTSFLTFTDAQGITGSAYYLYTLKDWPITNISLTGNGSRYTRWSDGSLLYEPKSIEFAMTLYRKLSVSANKSRERIAYLGDGNIYINVLNTLGLSWSPGGLNFISCGYSFGDYFLGRLKYYNAAGGLSFWRANVSLGGEWTETKYPEDIIERQSIIYGRLGIEVIRNLNLRLFIQQVKEKDLGELNFMTKYDVYNGSLYVVINQIYDKYFNRQIDKYQGRTKIYYTINF